MDVTGVLAEVESHALALGLFDVVSLHEPKSAPGSGLTCAVWVQSLGPAPMQSGLDITTALLVLNVRIYTPMLASSPEAADSIDPKVTQALDALITAYSGDFSLGGKVRNVDLLGQSGTALSAQSGYMNQDGKLYRVVTITLPMVINDEWDQVA